MMHASNATETLEVVNVLRRSAQGVTRPFLCQVADGRDFWVKGSDAGKRTLCAEWMAGSLARAAGLPIPPFAKLHVPKTIISQSLTEDISALGSGIVFGSQHVEHAQELTYLTAKQLMRDDTALALKLLMFDWWIQNDDRTLGEKGGNPNLLLGTDDQTLQVIDHNLAFGMDWNSDRFFENHVFTGSRRKASFDILQATREELKGLIPQTAQFWAEVPESWRYLFDDLPIDLTFESINAVLKRIDTAWEGDWL